jgi:hypothetical protein
LEFSNEQSAELDENSIDGLLSDVGWFQSEVPVVICALDALVWSDPVPADTSAFRREAAAGVVGRLTAAIAPAPNSDLDAQDDE